MDRLFPGLTPAGHEQTTLGASVGGLGWRRATDTALPANLGALVMAAPKVKGMAAAAVHAGLLQPGQVEAQLAARTAAAEADFLGGLDELERVRATEYLAKAKGAAHDHWQQVASGRGTSRLHAPRVDATFDGPSAAAQTPLADVHDGDAADQEGCGRRLTAPHVQKELAKL